MGLLDWARHFSGRQVVRGEDQLFSFAGVLEGSVSYTNLSAGTNVVDSLSVPAGEIWVVTQVCMSYVGTPPTSMSIQFPGLAGSIRVIQERTVVSEAFYPARVEVYLQEGNFVRLYIDGATAGDDADLHYAGYKMTLEAL